MNTSSDLLDNLDMDMDLDDVEVGPEFVDMMPGTYVLRVAGVTNKPVEIEDRDGDTIESSRLSIVFQIVEILSAEEPTPEVGGLFTIGGTVAFQRARDQVMRLLKKALDMADPDFRASKPTTGGAFQRLIELYDEDNLLQCAITLRDEKYPQIRTMQKAEGGQVDWQNFNKAEFEFTG